MQTYKARSSWEGCARQSTVNMQAFERGQIVACLKTERVGLGKACWQPRRRDRRDRSLESISHVMGNILFLTENVPKSVTKEEDVQCAFLTGPGEG